MLETWYLLGVDRLQLGTGWARSLALALAAMATCCAQVADRGRPPDTASEAGQDSGGSASLGGTGGTGGLGLALGGFPVEDDRGGRAAVPLLDTVLCGQDFVRVEQLPDEPRFFSGTFDGEPVDVSESADVSDAPTFYVFRFGATHVEAISFRLYLAEGPYKGFLQLSAVDCGPYGNLSLTEAQGPHSYDLDRAELDTVTHSVDGFSGLTTGSVSASWSDDDGEQHVLAAEFALSAVMDDANTLR